MSRIAFVDAVPLATEGRRVGRMSPITPAALILATAMALLAYAVAFASNLVFVSLPNPTPLIIAGLGTDLAAGYARDSRIAQATRISVFAILYLSLASIAGVLAAYAGQRFQMPLQDSLFAWADRAMGLDWGAFTRWIDCHAVVAGILRASYETMAAQIVAPALVLAFTGEDRRLRIYLLAFSIGLAMTTVVSALLPALSPIATVDRATYHVLNFPGATPLAHLAKLRGIGPALIDGDLGRIVSFPSFHATVAVLTPMVLCRFRLLWAVLVPLDALMLCASVSEGAHYASDVLAGVVVAVVAYGLAVRIEAHDGASLESRAAGAQSNRKRLEDAAPRV